MIFGAPYFLWLLIPVLACATMDALRHVVNNQAFGKITRLWAGQNKIRLAGPSNTVYHARWFMWLALTFGILALAQPRYGRIEEAQVDQSREILIALDLSKSMLAQDVAPSRIEHAKLLMQGLIDKLGGERAGLVLFAGKAFLQSPLSVDYEILQSFLPTLSPNAIPFGGTNYQALLNTSLESFGTAEGIDRFLIIFSDGEAFDQQWRTLLPKFKERGIHVIGLGVGTGAGGVIPNGEGGVLKDANGNTVISKLESGTLLELAKSTDGVFVDASSWVDMGLLLKKASDLSHKGASQTKDAKEKLIERYQWPLVPAFIFLLLSFWRELPIRPRARSINFGVLEQETKKGRNFIPSAVITASCFLMLFSLFTSHLRADDDDDDDDDHPKQANFKNEKPRSPVNAFADMLGRRVSSIIAKSEPTPYDYSSLAIDTVTYVEGKLRVREQVPLAVIYDALAGVDKGEAMDKEAGNWPMLRGNLEDLLVKAKLPAKGLKSEQAYEIDNSPDADADKDPKNAADGKQNAIKNQTAADQKDAQQRKMNLNPLAAFGNMKEGDKNVNLPVMESPDVQKVGGVKSRQSRERTLNPNLALPLQKLDQVRNQDSPAKLFLIMESDPNALPPSGPDW